MRRMKEALAAVTFEGAEGVGAHPVPRSRLYRQWEANDVISYELVRNLLLNFASVVLVSLLLLANLRITFLVLVVFAAVY